MKRFLIFVVFVILTGFGLVGCKGDNGITSQNQSIDQSQDDANISNPSDPGNTDTSDPGTSNENASAICYANNFVGEKFHVVEYQNLIITADIDPTNCRLLNDRLKGEVRRSGVRDLREFVGDVRGIHGNQITIYTGSLPKSCLPKKGEALKIIWKTRRRG